MSDSIRWYRCYECQSPERQAKGKSGYEFSVQSSDKEPKCPSCGTPIASERGKLRIHPMSVIHFEPPAKAAEGSKRAISALEKGGGHRMYLNSGSGVIACNPTRVSTGNLHATGEPKAVTCPKCKETDSFKSMAKGAIDERFDLPIVPDGSGGIAILGLPNNGDVTPADVAAAGEALDQLRAGGGRK